VFPVLIDCDPGQDDALALLLALGSPELDVLGVTAVAGNQTLDKTTANALRVLELAGRPDIPVAAGADGPLAGALVVAADAHGETGLDGVDLPTPSAEPVSEDAKDFLAARLEASERPVTLVALGPLTNVALLLEAHPEAASKIERIVLMGGAIHEGNQTPSAEFNIWIDPEAAAHVFESGLDVTTAARRSTTLWHSHTPSAPISSPWRGGTSKWTPPKVSAAAERWSTCVAARRAPSPTRTWPWTSTPTASGAFSWSACAPSRQLRRKPPV
jgi:inosine-uridine nucleoside N-ribohydrolase